MGEDIEKLKQLRQFEQSESKALQARALKNSPAFYFSTNEASVVMNSLLVSRNCGRVWFGNQGTNSRESELLDI